MGNYQRISFGVDQEEWASTTEINDEVIVKFKLVAKKK